MIVIVIFISVSQFDDGNSGIFYAYRLWHDEHKCQDVHFFVDS